MRVVKYAKYNRTKAPAFQVKTLIVQDGTEIFVEKSALCKEAQAHIESFEEKYKELAQTYQNVVPAAVKLTDRGARFDYINGNSVKKAVDNSISDRDAFMGTVKKYIDEIFVYRPERTAVWKSTPEFEKIFGVQELPEGIMGVTPANIDAIFDNFIETENKIVCLDYEWTFNFSVPQQYIIFRTLMYYYSENREKLEDIISQDEYFNAFGINEAMRKIYENMEDSFQQYAHGENRKYIYTSNYVKKNANLEDVIKSPDKAVEYVESFAIKDEEIRKLNERLKETIDDTKSAHERLHAATDELIQTHERLAKAVEEIQDKDKHIADYQAAVAKYHRMLKNPFYAAGVIGKKVVKKSGRAVMKALPPVAARGITVLKNEGMDVFCYKLKNRRKVRNEYQVWIEQNETNLYDTEPLAYNPLISVVVPVYNVADNMLRACIDSVIGQTYTNWELCLVDDCSTMKSVRTVLSEYEGRDRIKIKYRSENGHISRTTNDGIAMASGEFVGLMDCDDYLAPDALYEMAKKLNENKDYDFIYSDEDKVNEEGTERRDPFFKPDWSPDTFMSYMYTCHFSVFRKSLIDEIGGLRIGYEGSQDYDLVLRIMEKTRNIGHVPKILYHWRMRKESTANDLTAKPYIIESTIKAKEDALSRRGLKGKLTKIESVTQFRVTYEPQNNPFVSIIIPSKDNYDILKRCIESVKEVTTYGNYEIVVVDNGSSEENMIKYKELADKYGCTYFHEIKDFNFSYMCNKGASLAKGSLLLFLNDDIEIPKNQGEWLSIMAGQAQVSYTGAVGAKLIYPGTNLVQHAGVLNLPIGPGHAFHRFDDSLNFYWGRNILDYNYAIVTGACLMVDRNKFDEIGKFDETFPVAYNDVELCFKLLEHGYFNVLRNDVKLIHHESISRGYDESPEKAARLLRERGHLYEVHPLFKGGYDPCYNPNLTKDKGDFSLNISGNMVMETPVVNPAGLVLDKNVKCSVDRAEYSDGLVKIGGWVYRENSKKNNKEHARVVLVSSTGKLIAVPTVKTYRPDVSAAHGRHGNLALTGFECSFKCDDSLKNEKYTIAVAAGKYYTMTEKTISLY